MYVSKIKTFKALRFNAAWKRIGVSYILFPLVSKRSVCTSLAGGSIQKYEAPTRQSGEGKTLSDDPKDLQSGPAKSFPQVGGGKSWC